MNRKTANTAKVSCPKTIRRLVKRVVIAAGIFQAGSLAAQTAQNFPNGISLGTNPDSFIETSLINENATGVSTILKSLEGGIELRALWAETNRGYRDGGVHFFGKPITMVLGAESETNDQDKGSFEVWRYADYFSGGPQALPAFSINTASNTACFNGLSISVGGGTMSVMGSPVVTVGGVKTVLEDVNFGSLSLKGILNLANTTASTSSTTGALTIAGGMGVAKDSWINGVRIGRGGGITSLVTASSTSVGKDALQSNTSGKFNTAVGTSALYSNLNGNYNTSVGTDSMKNNTSGYNNTAMGFGALFGNISGYWNTSQGYQALYANTTGYCNVASGGAALSKNTTGFYNAALGISANRENTTGNSNCSIGCASMLYCTEGSQNVAIGAWSLYGNINGNSNIAIGYSAGRYQSDGSTVLEDSENCIYVGANSRGKDNDDDNSVVIGANAIGEGANTTVIGSTATTSTHLFGQTKLDSLKVSGQVIIEQPQGDISMGIYGN